MADDRDRSQWLSVLAHVVDRYGWRCHAYCLMVNHYHLLIETPQACCFSGKARLRGSSTRPIGSMGIGLAEIADYLGVHPATVSRRLKQAEQANRY